WCWACGAGPDAVVASCSATICHNRRQISSGGGLSASPCAQTAAAPLSRVMARSWRASIPSLPSGPLTPLPPSPTEGRGGSEEASVCLSPPLPFVGEGVGG